MSTPESGLIIGAGGGGKGGGGSARVAQEAPDSLRSKAYARVVDLVCEGEIEGLAAGLQSVYLDDTPIQNPDGSYNFTGVTLETRPGTQQQSYVPGFSSVENEVAVGVECKTSQPVVRSINDPDVDAVRIKVSIPTLSLQDTTNGDLNGTSVSYAIDVQAHGAGYVQVLADTVSGKTTSRYQRSYYMPLTGTGPWDVRLRRITADSTQTSLQNKTFLESYTEVIESKLRYPNSALMALRVDASQFTSIPRRSYDLKLLHVRIPSNYFPETRSYAGVWDGTFKVAWTDNPAWCFYDLVTNTRYGLGSFIPESQVDKWALYRVARYCDELVPDGLGGYEPRFTCNLYLQSREQAYKVVQDMASIFRGMAYWSGGAITVTHDAPQDPVYQFTAANVIDGEFAYQGSSAKARHTVALVSWTDPDDFYRQKVEYVEDMAGIARYGVVQADVVAMGCTSRGQANRVGKWLLYSEQSESEIITFRTGLEGAVVRPGDVIKVADSSRGGLRLGGRIAAATTVSVTLDQDLPAGSWRISVLLPTGAVEERQVGSLSGRTVGVTSAFSTAPQVGAIWVLASTQVETQLFRVVQVAESEPGIHEVTALAHNPSKYDAIEQGLALQPRDITVLSTTPVAPTGLSVTESLYRVKDQALVLIQVGWEQVFGALEYQVSYRVNGGNTVTLPRVSATYLEIRNADAGDYVFTVRAVGVSGKLGASVTLSQTILGKLQPPDDVQDFVVLRRTTDLLLSWSANTDADLAGYEVRVGTGWDAGTLVGQTAGSPARYHLQVVERTIDVPDFADPVVPTQTEYKLARKALAVVMKEAGLEPGRYELQDAKVRIDAARERFRLYLEKRLAPLDREMLAMACVEQHDSLLLARRLRETRVHQSRVHQVDYDRLEALSETRKEFESTARNYRYLLEKTVSSITAGQERVTRQLLRELIGLVDWYMVLAGASDVLHNQVDVGGVEIDDQFVPEVFYSETWQEREEEYAHELARIRLGDGINNADAVEGAVAELLVNENLQKAVRTDLGFELQKLLQALTVLTQPVCHGLADDLGLSYQGEPARLARAIEQGFEGITPAEAAAIVSFLTLSGPDIRRLSGKAIDESDVPFWEHSKRLHRYAIRPLVPVGTQVFWGAEHASRSQLIWLSAVRDGALPADFRWPNVQKVVRSIKKSIEDALEDRAVAILKRHTPYVEGGIDFFRRFGKEGFADVGDYDVFAYWPATNTVLYTECKYNQTAYSIKDSRRLRDRMFGVSDKDRDGQYNPITCSGLIPSTS